MIRLSPGRMIRATGAASAIGILAAWSTWNFWSSGTATLGIAFAIVWSATLAFFFYATARRLTLRKAFTWAIPLFMIALSIGIYRNPFTQTISTLLLPILFFLFTTDTAHKQLRAAIWSRFFPLAGIIALSHGLASIFGMPTFVARSLRSADGQRTVVVPGLPYHQIALGLLGFAAVALFVVIPLLSGADPAFARVFADLMTWVANLLSLTTVTKYLLAALLTAILLVLTYYWHRDDIPAVASSTDDTVTHANSVAIGIMIGGILALYLLFIGIQIRSVFVGTLPIDFGTTEHLVKTGFWQLFILTAFNAILYIGLFGRTHRIVQRILGAFTVASLLLVVTAGYRVWLYVTVYGLSYEKFFAFYTVVFCTGVFAWFLWLLLSPHHGHRIARTLGIAALWCYALAVVMPLERIIFTTNLALTQRPDSRIDINELRMLSIDAAPVAERSWDTLMHQATVDHVRVLAQQPDPALDDINDDQTIAWRTWLRDVRSTMMHRSVHVYDTCSHAIVSSSDPTDAATCVAKKWYEMTLTELLYMPRISDADLALTPQDEPLLQN